VKRRDFIAGLGGAAAWPLAAPQQQGDRVRRIGVLMGYDENDPEGELQLSTLTRALADLGWADGRNVWMDIRYAGGTRRAQEAPQALADATSMTFGQCRDAYIAAHPPSWSNVKHSRQWTSTLATYVTPVFGMLPVASIDTGMVLRVPEPMWPTKTETASRLRGRIENILDWARVRGYRAGENPARWKGHLVHLLPAKTKVKKIKHHPALPYTDRKALARHPSSRLAALPHGPPSAGQGESTNGLGYAYTHRLVTHLH
jgi:hypothetical protein